MRTKALQWQKTSDTVLCWAHTVLGSYRVWKIGADGEWDWSFEGYDTRETFIGKVPTEEAAKLAAQSHFDAAIASVLEDDWQTMETAPKDNTRVLTFGDGLVGTSRYSPRFSEKYGGDTSPGWYSEQLDRRHEPSYWRPLPSPPKAGE